MAYTVYHHHHDDTVYQYIYIIYTRYCTVFHKTGLSALTPLHPNRTQIWGGVTVTAVTTVSDCSE